VKARRVEFVLQLQNMYDCSTDVAGIRAILSKSVSDEGMLSH
jgi:hypothetical protein